MLEKLTDEQTRLMYEHRDNYKDFIINNGAHVPQRLKVEDIKDDIEWLYKKAGLEPPKHILIANSYLNEKLMINYVKRYGIPKLEPVKKLIYEIIIPMYMKVFHSTNGHNDQKFIDYIKPLKDIVESNANNIKRSTEKKVTDPDNTERLIKKFKKELWTCVQMAYHERTNFASNGIDDRPLQQQIIDTHMMSYNVASTNKDKVSELDGKDITYFIINQIKKQLWNDIEKTMMESYGLTYGIFPLIDNATDMYGLGNTIEFNTQNKIDDDRKVGEKIIGDLLDNIWHDMFDRINEKVSRKTIVELKEEYVVDGPILDSDNISINKTTHDKLNNISSNQSHESIDSFITSISHVMIDALRYLVSPEIRYHVNTQLLRRPDIDDMDDNIGDRLEDSTEKQLESLPSSSSEDVEEPIKKALAKTILEMKVIIDKENIKTLYEVSAQTITYFQDLVFRSIIEIYKLATIRALDKHNDGKDEKLEFIEQGFGLSWNSWLSFYYFFVKIGIIKNEDFERYYNFMIKGIWSIQFFKDWCICTQMPLKIQRDANNRLHSMDGPTIEWRDNNDDILVSQQQQQGQEQEQQLTKEEMINNSVRDKDVQYLIIKYVIGICESFNIILHQLPNKVNFLSDVSGQDFTAMNIQRKTSDDIQAYDQIDVFIMNLISSLNTIFNSGTLPHMRDNFTDSIYQTQLNTEALIIRNKTSKEVRESSSLNSKKRNIAKDYFIHGVAFDEELWEKVVSDKLTVKEVLDIKNMEQRNIILTMIPPSRLVKELDAKLISTHTQKKKGKSFLRKNYDDLEHKEIKLYHVDAKKLGLDNNVPIYILFYTDPSTDREYFSYIRPGSATDAATAMASKFGLSKKEYLHNLEAES